MIFAERSVGGGDRSKTSKEKTNTNADKTLWDKEHPKLQLISFCVGHLLLSLL